MTISSTTRKAGPFAGNGVATVFPFGFKVFDKTDIKLILVDQNGNSTTLVLDSDYSVALNSNQDSNPGGSISYPIIGNPLATGLSLVALGALEYEQPTNITNGGGFYPNVIEQMSDRSTIQIQQLAENVSRAIVLNESESASPVLPTASGRANMLLGFDAVGNVTVLPITASVGAGDLHDELGSDGKPGFVAGTDFTAGTTTQLALSRAPGSLANMWISFDGTVQGGDQVLSIVNQILTFTGPIPLGTQRVYVRTGTTLSTQIPPDGSVTPQKLASGFNFAIDCLSAGTNAITLTPALTGFVLAEYRDHQQFSFTAPAQSTDLVTVKVGVLPTLPLYRADGLQCGARDLNQDAYCFAAYNSSLNSGAGGFLLLNTPTTGLSIIGQQSLNNTPSGSPLPTQSSLMVYATTQTTDQEFMAEFEFVSNKASNALGGNVTLYSLIRGQAGSAGIWAFNNVALIDAGFPYTTQSVFGQELDINNSAGAYGEFGTANSVGIMLQGLGYRNTCGIFMTTATGAPLWYYGMRFETNAVAQATIQDQSSSVVTLDIRGVHSYGVDCGNAGTFGGGAIRLGAGSSQGVVSSTGNNTPVSVVYADAAGHTYIGAQAASNHFVNGNLQPVVDNTYSSGSASLRWASVWAANGAIQTSDPSLKTDIADLPEALPIVNRLEPKTWKWINGGYDEIEQDIEESYQVTTTVTETQTSIVMRDGAPVQVSTPVTTEIPVFDDAQVIDENGKPVFTTLPAQAEKHDSVTGEVVAEARPETVIPLMHRAPRMATRMVKKKVLQERAGRRTHWGFLAPDVKAAFDVTGVDFAGYVKDEDGTQHLRPDQLIPVLWKAVQELCSRIEKLEGRSNNVGPV